MATTVLALLVARRSWHWPYIALIPIALVLLTIDLAFFSANMLKIASGGWFPLALGLTMYVIMLTWRRGRRIVLAHMNNPIALQDFIASLHSQQLVRVDGIAIFLSAHSFGVPNALLHNLNANQTLHKFNVILTVEILETPKAAQEERVNHVECGDGFHRIEMRFGFAEDTNIPSTLRAAAIPGLDFDSMRATYFISRGQMVASKFAGMSRWRARLFAFMMRNASSATSRFHLPENGLIEIGSRIDV